MAATWSDFQSFVQIAVGFNAAYFSIAQFMNPDSIAETSRLKEVIDVAKKHKTVEGMGAVIASLIKLHTDIRTRERKDSGRFAVFRALSVLFFVAGIITLFFMSIWPDRRADPIFVSITLVLVLPFMGGVGYVFFYSSPAYSYLAKRRVKLEVRLDQVILSANGP